MKATEERYELVFDEQINGGGKENLKGIVIDVVPDGDKDGLMSSKKPQLIIMTPDTKETEGHTPLGYIEFEDKDDLALAQIGLDLIQEAISRSQDD